MREAVEASRVQVVMEGYTSRMEAFVKESTDWAYQKIADLCSSVIDSDSVEEEIRKFNKNSPKINAYWIKEDDSSKMVDKMLDDSSPRVAIGRSLLQKDFHSSQAKSVLPITIVVKSQKNVGLLLFYLSLEDLFESMEALVQGDPNIQIAILKDNNEVLLSVNLDRQVNFLNLRRGRFSRFVDLIKGKYSRELITRNKISFISVYYFYASDIDIFPSPNFVVYTFLSFLWFFLSFIGHLFFRVEISKLLSVVSGESVNCRFYLSEFYETYSALNTLLKKCEDSGRRVTLFIDENNKLKELNNVYSLERVTMKLAIDELTAEKEVLLIDKVVLEEKIDYLRRKAVKNAE